MINPGAGAGADAEPTVLGIGYRIEDFLGLGHSAVSLPIGPARGELTGLHDEIAAALPLAAPAVAIVPERWRVQVERRLRTVELAAERRPFGVYSSALPPLAGAVLGAIAVAIAPRLRRPGLLLAALPAIERELIWLTLLRRVSGLEFPPPSFKQQSSALLPGRRFVAASWPEPELHTVRDGRPFPALPDLLSSFSLAVSRGARAGEETWSGRLAEAFGGLPSRDYEPTPIGAEWWGSDSIVEAVAYPVDVEALAIHAESQIVPARCQWCAESIGSSPCPFCGHARGPLRAEAEGESEMSRGKP